MQIVDMARTRTQERFLVEDELKRRVGDTFLKENRCHAKGLYIMLKR